MSELMTRAAEFRPGSLNEEARTVDVVWSTGSRVMRYGGPLAGRWSEELDLAGARMERLNSGASVLDSHQSGSVRNILGRVERAWVEGNTGYATVRMSSRPDMDGIWQDIRSGILQSISVGYRIHKVETHKGKGDNGADLGRVVDWTPTELSFVAQPADSSARVRSEDTEVTEAGAASESGRSEISYLLALNAHRSRRQA